MYEIKDDQILKIEEMQTKTQKAIVKRPVGYVKSLTIMPNKEKLVIGMICRVIADAQVIETLGKPQGLAEVYIENIDFEAFATELDLSKDQEIDLSEYAGHGQVRVVVKQEHVEKAQIEVIL